MSLATDTYKAFKQGFDNKDSSQAEKFMTDDFVMVTKIGTRSRQETLDWIAAGGNPTTIDDMELLYENDEIAVLMHSARGGTGQGTVMACGTKKGGKFSSWRIVRQAV